jgi:hypothetical protein
MLIGNAGITSAVASIVLTFYRGSRQDLTPRPGLVVLELLMLWMQAPSETVDRFLTWIIRACLQNSLRSRASSSLERTHPQRLRKLQLGATDFSRELPNTSSMEVCPVLAIWTFMTLKQWNQSYTAGSLRSFIHRADEAFRRDNYFWIVECHGFFIAFWRQLTYYTVYPCRLRRLGSIFMSSLFSR